METSYIVFSILIDAKEHLFMFSYNKDSNETFLALGALIRISNLCYIKGYGFDFFEVMQDPNLILLKEGIYITEYTNMEDLIKTLNIELDLLEQCNLCKLDHRMYTVLKRGNHGEILALLHGQTELSEQLRKLFLN